MAALAVMAPPASALEQNRALTQYMHRIWQSQQGLPLASIRAILQTSDGYLWLGTESGLFRFDGVRFTSASDISELLAADISVAALLEDSDHNLWIAARKDGLLRMRDGTVSRISQAEGRPLGNVSCLISDSSSNVWACTSAGVLEIRGGASRILDAGSVSARNGATTACITGDGRVWLAGQGPRILIWDGRHFTPYLVRSLPSLAVVQAMLASRDGSVWIGTTDGLVRIENGVEKRFTASSGLPGNSILSLAEGQDDTLWIGTSSGFSRFRKGALESYTTKAGLSQSTIYSIFEDAQGSLWVGTKRGLNQFLDRRTVPITTSEGLPSNDTGPVLQGEDGSLWVGTIGAGLARMNGPRFSVMTRADGLSSNSIYALAGGNSGDLWVGTDRGLNRLRNGRPAETFTAEDGLPHGLVKSLYTARNGVLWIGTTHGLAFLRDGRIARIGGASGGNPVVSIEGDRRGRIYAAVEGIGISVYDESTMREIPAEQIPVRNAVSLYADGDLLWIGTHGNGLNLLDRGEVKEFLPADGIFDDEIFGIASDGEGLLWMACSKGIFSVKRDDLLRFAAGTLQHVASTPYSPLEGLQTVECKSGVQPAVWHLADGHVAFSTIRGLLLMDPSQAAWKLPPPRAVVEKAVINGRTLPVGDIPDLSAGTKNVDFVYTGLDLRSPGRITFRYKLESFNRDWVNAGARREASYTNLQPGRYRFRLMACIGEGNCTETAGASFVIPARFYQRAWFPFLCGGLIVLMAWLAYQARIQHLKRQFAVILAERIRIARELHDTLLQGFSGVTMEMQALAQRLPSDSRKVLDEIIGDAANCLREVRHLLANLRHEQARRSGLGSAIARAASQANGGDVSRLKFDLEPVPALLSAHTEYNLLRIVQEAVTNAVNHSGASRINIVLRSHPKRIVLSVADDGSGFNTAGGVDGHYGLIGMKERAREIGADLNIASHPGEGTIITVELPFVKNGDGAALETRDVEKVLLES